MRRGFLPLCAVCIVVLLRASAVNGQVAPTAEVKPSAFSFGTGLTSWSPDFGNGRMLGITAWSDYVPPLPPRFDGLGIEAEARNVNWHRSSGQPSILRETTFGGGPIYRLTRYRIDRIASPYAKFLVCFGGMDFRFPGSTYTHDTRTVFAPGGGVQARAYQSLWVRFDYEYQIWQPMFSTRPTPQGFTLGLVWDRRDSLKHEH